MVAHHPQPSGWHPDVELGLGRRVAGVQVRLLVQGHPVDRHVALRVAADDVVAGQPDDPLDVVVHPGGDAEQADHRVAELAGPADDRVAGLGCAGRVPGAFPVEHDDVAAVDRAEVIDQLVDQDLVPDVERVLHRRGRDVEGLDHVGLDDQHDDQREREQRDELHPPGDAAAAPGLGRGALGRGGGPGPAGLPCAVGRGAIGRCSNWSSRTGRAAVRRPGYRLGARWLLVRAHGIAVLARPAGARYAARRRIAHSAVIIHHVDPSAGVPGSVPAGCVAPAAALRLARRRRCRPPNAAVSGPARGAPGSAQPCRAATGGSTAWPGGPGPG